MAYVTASAAGEAGPTADAGDRLAVDIRGTAEPAEMVTLPFYKRPAGN
jgi:hypothetical protein